MEQHDPGQQVGRGRPAHIVLLRHEGADVEGLLAKVRERAGETDLSPEALAVFCRFIDERLAAEREARARRQGFTVIDGGSGDD